MKPILIHTILESDTLVLPQLRPLIGKLVEIRITDPGAEDDGPLDPDEFDRYDDEGPVPTLQEVRAALSGIPGNMTADFIAERGER